MLVYHKEEKKMVMSLSALTSFLWFVDWAN